MLKMIAQCIKKAPYIVVIVFMTGCVTALPMKHEYTSRETLPLPFDDVWELSSNFLEQNVSAIDTADKKSGYIITKEFNVPYNGFQYQSEYADCGQLGSLYVYHEIVGNYEIFISPLEDNRSSIRIIPDYRASLWIGKSFKGWVPCQSRGYFEQLLVNDLRTKKKESHALDIQNKDMEATVDPGTNMSSETEMSELKVKYKNALQNIDKLNNEVSMLKKQKENEKNKRYAGKPETSGRESSSGSAKTSYNGVTARSSPKKTARSLSQEKDVMSEIYTIQTGSFLNIDRAQEQFSFIAEHMKAKDYNNLRIERIGKYYTVRLGKYENDSSTKELLQKLNHKIKSPVVLKAYIKEDRIIKP